MTAVAAHVAALTLDPDPISVREARSFVCDRLAEFGYPGHAELAALATSELATNAVLHARTAFTLSVTELSGGGVRVAVRDGSTAMPTMPKRRPTTAVGRGIRLVQRLADTWGVDRLGKDDPDAPGKEVWFEVGLPRQQGSVPPATTYDPTGGDPLTVIPAAPPQVLVDVQLLNTPLELYAREMARQSELMREMAFIAFSELTPGGMPAALIALAAEIEDYRGVGAATDAMRDAAIARGEISMDLHYQLPSAAGPACERLNELLDEADEYCRAENLLTLAAPPEGTRMRQWYLSEIARQVRGTPATPWDGPLH